MAESAVCSVGVKVMTPKAARAARTRFKNPITAAI
jgi:hypothetical protein